MTHLSAKKQLYFGLISILLIFGFIMVSVYYRNTIARKNDYIELSRQISNNLDIYGDCIETSLSYNRGEDSSEYMKKINLSLSSKDSSKNIMEEYSKYRLLALKDSEKCNIFQKNISRDLIEINKYLKSTNLQLEDFVNSARDEFLQLNSYLNSRRLFLGSNNINEINRLLSEQKELIKNIDSISLERLGNIEKL